MSPHLGVLRQENPLVWSSSPAQVWIPQVVAGTVPSAEVFVGVAGGSRDPGTALGDGRAGVAVEAGPEANDGLEVGQVVVGLDEVGGAQEDGAHLVQPDDVSPGSVESE